MCWKETKERGFVLPLGVYPGTIRTNYAMPLHFVNTPGPEQWNHVNNLLFQFAVTLDVPDVVACKWMSLLQLQWQQPADGFDTSLSKHATF